MTHTSDPAGATPLPLRANDSTDLSDNPSVHPTGSLGTAERPRVGVNVTPTDPRAIRKAPPRDVATGTLIGELGEATRDQLRRGQFADVADSILSRWLKRMASRGLIVVERWNETGITRIRLTRAGRDFLVDRGVPAEQLFCPKRSLAPGIAAHSYTIGDVLLALRCSDRPPASILTAWSIQRVLRERFPVIPDLLAIYRRRDGSAKLTLAIEVDLATESLKGTFLPKLARLSPALDSFAEGTTTAILILTRGQRRIDALRSAFQEAGSTQVFVEALPNETGRRRIDVLGDVFRRFV